LTGSTSVLVAILWHAFADSSTTGQTTTCSRLPSCARPPFARRGPAPAALPFGVLLRVCLYPDHVINAQDGDGGLRRKLRARLLRRNQRPAALISKPPGFRTSPDACKADLLNGSTQSYRRHHGTCTNNMQYTPSWLQKSSSMGTHLPLPQRAFFLGGTHLAVQVKTQQADPRIQRA